MTWATNHDASLENLKRVQGSLTVGLIMVPRVDFLTCRQAETAIEIKTRNTDSFSSIPVVDENDRVVGLYNAERWFYEDAPNTLVGNDYEPLSEDNVIGADASIFDFVMQADKRSTNLVVSGNEIAGLISLSDLQQLPVRAALFALITSLEMAMALAIEKQWPDPQDWMSFLSDVRRTKVVESAKEARAKDGFVSEIALTQLHDKADVICKGKLLDTGRNRTEQTFNQIGRLRDKIAHSNHYAENPEAAKKVCEIVRSVYKIKDVLLKRLEQPAT